MERWWGSGKGSVHWSVPWYDLTADITNFMIRNIRIISPFTRPSFMTALSTGLWMSNRLEDLFQWRSFKVPLPADNPVVTCRGGNWVRVPYPVLQWGRIGSVTCISTLIDRSRTRSIYIYFYYSQIRNLNSKNIFFLSSTLTSLTNHSCPLMP